MTWIAHSRRAAAVLLVVLALVAVPAIAEARFSAARKATLTTSTATMLAPVSVSGTYRCIGRVVTEGFEVSVDSFVDDGPAGSTYRYSLLRGSKVIKTSTSTSNDATISTGNQPVDVGTTDWTLSIQAVHGSWTGPTYTRTVTCRTLSNATGPL